MLTPLTLTDEDAQGWRDDPKHKVVAGPNVNVLVARSLREQARIALQRGAVLRGRLNGG